MNRFKVEDIIGDVWLSTSGGSISLDDIVGNVEARTSGGSISTDNIEGDLDIRTSGGSLKLENISGNVIGKTSGGSIRAEVLQQVSNELDLRTSGGSIVLLLPSSFMGDLNASTSAGRVSSDFPILTKSTKRSSLVGELNGGGVSINLRSSAGSISIREI